MNKVTDSSKLHIPADANALERVRLHVLEKAEMLHLPQPKIFKLELALEEIIVNIVNYAYPAGTPGYIDVFCTIRHQDTIEIEIHDAGQAFDPLQREEPDLEQSIEAREIGGLGIFLTREMVDEISYRRDNNENIITFSIAYE